jgi:hypothetical protein
MHFVVRLLHSGLIQPGALLLAMTFAISTTVYAQGGGSTTSLSGTVSDTTGAVVPGATVAVKNNATSTQFEAVTNESGFFTVPAIDPGGYTVTVTLAGFKTAVLNDVRIAASTPATVKIALAMGGLEETVMVQGGTEIVQTQSAAVTSTIDANQILKLPTGSRSALEFVTHLPGVSTPGGSRQNTINGLPQSSINITIDGMSAQDNYLKTTDGFFARVSPRLDAMEEVTVSMAAQNAASTGQGAVQIQFVTRSGTNEYRGRGYYYLRHYKLNANTWFNNRSGTPKGEDITHSPGGNVGGPISIPGLFNGRNKAFFFFNYEESRSPGQNSETRQFLHPRAEEGFFRYVANNQIREVNLLALAAQARYNFTSTIDPTIGRLLADIRNSTSGLPVVDLTDPLLRELRYQYDSDSTTRYPTVRLDYNATSKHRITGSWNYTKLLSTPDTTNNREPNFPGFPGTGNQHSTRYTIQTSLRSTLASTLVNEFRVGGSGGATFFSPEISPAQFTGTSVADQGGYLLDINGDFLGVTNAHSIGSTSSREASTKVVDNTLSWIKGSHSIQMGGSWTRQDVWLKNQTQVPTITFGINSNDPAEAMFTQANFEGASAAQLNDARELYATLAGRVIGISGDARLNASDQYVYLGEGLQRARLSEYGFFFADSWRWKPNVTINAGLRYVLQLPFYPLNNSYSTATIDDVWGRSGVGNLFRPGGLTGKSPTYIQFNEGDGAYNTDRNNWAPSLGMAWTLGGKAGILGTVLGREEGTSVLRAGYALAYNRPGMADFTDAIDDNPGISIAANRSNTLNNLGPAGSILLRNRGDLGPPPFASTRNYPMTDNIDQDVRIFDPNLQTPYSQTYTAGWQRKLTRDMAVEVRYVGSRSAQPWIEYNFNEINIVENNFLNEFRLAQQNLQAHIAQGCGGSGQPSCSFAYRGPGTGTSPLPIFLAYFQGVPAAQAATAAYTSTQFTSGTFVNPLARFNPQPTTAANALDADAGRRQNALNAGLAANFLVVNPDLLGGAEITGNGGYTKFNSVQLELRKRLSAGLQFQGSYVYGKQYLAQRYGFRRGWATRFDGGDEGGVVHAMKANWVYELPWGRDRKFGSSMPAWLDQFIGGWDFDGLARIQSGRVIEFGNVRVVGMSVKEFQDSFKLRFDDAGQVVFMLPQDIIDNTVRAFDVSATSSSGYGARGAPTGRYLAPAQGPDCIEAAQQNTNTAFGDCGTGSLVTTGPRLVRFDLSAVKRFNLVGRMNMEFRAEFLNAFNHPWFTAVSGANSNTYNNPDSFRVTGADSGREIQFVWRLNW